MAKREDWATVRASPTLFPALTAISSDSGVFADRLVTDIAKMHPNAT